MSDIKVIKKEDLSEISCRSCEKPLLLFWDEKTSKEVLYKLVVNCPYCNDKSYVQEIYGPMRQIPVDGVRLLNFFQNEDLTEISTAKEV